jgi:hypothetical protein
MFAKVQPLFSGPIARIWQQIYCGFFKNFLVARVCWPFLGLCRPFCIFRRCRDSSPESCPSKQQVPYQLSYPSPSKLATDLPKLSHPSPYGYSQFALKGTELSKVYNPLNPIPFSLKTGSCFNYYIGSSHSQRNMQTDVVNELSTPPNILMGVLDWPESSARRWQH